MAEPLEPPKKPPGPSTMSVHGGEPRQKPVHALTTPIVQTATYTWANSQELKDYFDGKIDARVDYGRYGNPTQKVAESKLAALEGAANGGNAFGVVRFPPAIKIRHAHAAQTQS